MQKGFNVMKKLICLMAVFVVLFTACGNNANDNADNARGGIVQDSDGIIDEGENNNIMDDTANGVRDLTNGAANATRDAVDGVENAVDDMTGMNRNNNSKNSMK